MAADKAIGTNYLDYLKVLLILSVLRIVMIDSGITFIRIPFFDSVITHLVVWMRQFVATYFT